MNKRWSIESANGNRQVVTTLSAEKNTAAVSENGCWLLLRDKQDNTIVAVFSQRTLLSAVVLEAEGEGEGDE